jgi:shikimate dehydrogenase
VEAQRIGLIGDPVEHSLSPIFQQPAFDALELNIRYELWPTPLERFADRISDLRHGRAIGANVTVPHKEIAFRSMDTVSDVATRACAVNTIVRRDGTLHGENTDVHGFIVPLVEQHFAFDASHAVILGAGGAARGIVVALLDAGIRQVTILNRTVERAHHIASALSDARISVGPPDSVISTAETTHLLVNATAIGWNGTNLPVDPAVFGLLPDGAIVYDLTYRTTPYLRSAMRAGVRTIDGLPMLVHQGARSFELWTGQSAPIDLMWRAAVAERAARGG